MLIPPSIIMIVYGVAADVSISKLFIAGIFPGMLLAGLFMGYIAIWALLHPGKIPAADQELSFFQKLYQSRHLIPVVILIAVRSEEQTSELQSLMRISSAVFCLKKNT